VTVRKSIKHLASLLLIPVVRWYLRKERAYRYADVNVAVSPGIFHPGFFSSTKFLVDYIVDQNLTGKSFLELGCGTGLISIVAARAGANVTASDINTKAVENARRNAKENGVSILVQHSDLFRNLKPQRFDWIVINPPYYPKAPKTDADHAWYCGEKFEYFKDLFARIDDFIHADTEIIMVLTKGCDQEKIFSIAAASHFQFSLLKEKPVIFDERDYLYRIRKIN
jgi:release factor glutamine methyltransferase